METSQDLSEPADESTTKVDPPRDATPIVMGAFAFFAVASVLTKAVRAWDLFAATRSVGPH
jgi:hypothetical protein